MVAGSIRRKVEDTKPLNWEDIALKLLDANPRDATLIATLYLSARRINEVTPLQKKDFKVEAHRISFRTFNEKVFHKYPQTGFDFRREITRYHAQRDSEGKVVYPLNWINPYKDTIYNQTIHPHWRTDSDSGEALTKFLLDTLESLQENDYVMYRLRGGGHIGYEMAYKIIRYYFPDAWPHLLRHERFTEYFRAYKSDPIKAHQMTDHKRWESSLGYIRELEVEEEKI